MSHIAFTVRLPRELAEALAALAKANERSREGEARVAIKRYVSTATTEVSK